MKKSEACQCLQSFQIPEAELLELLTDGSNACFAVEAGENTIAGLIARPLAQRGRSRSSSTPRKVSSFRSHR